MTVLMHLLTIPVSLTIIFEESQRKAKFPDTWKKANAFPLYKKEDKNLFLLVCFSTFSKVFGMVIYSF